MAPLVQHVWGGRCLLGGRRALPTIMEAGKADGMIDCVAENEIVDAKAAPYICDDCWAQYRRRKLWSCEEF
jgi:hypothetical protein